LVPFAKYAYFTNGDRINQYFFGGNMRINLTFKQELILIAILALLGILTL
jgi:hypothetical protein